MSGTKINIRDHGPLLIEGPFTLVDAAGNQYKLDSQKPAYALCRCGASANKPFCDGAHKTCGFQSAERCEA